jgi:hypothetical protein
MRNATLRRRITALSVNLSPILKSRGRFHHNYSEPCTAAYQETNMTTYFTIGDFILVIPMALAGALFLGACPCATEFRHNVLRVLGALLGVVVAVLLVEGLPVLV